MTSQPSPSLGRSGAIMASGSLVSRAVGLVRAALLTGVVGATGYAADGFNVANTLPNQFYLLLAGGALNAILVPQIVRAKICLLYTSDAADERSSVDLGGRRIIKKKKP